MKNVLLFASMFVVGCGSPEQQAAVVAALGATPTPVAETPVAETPVMMSRTMAAPAAIEPAKLYSLRVMDASSLPDCFVENEAQLAYASTEKQFYVCQAESWLAIDITGAAGKDGQSIVGAAGRDGRDGVDGQSIVGPRGIDGQSIVGAAGRDGRDGIDGQSITGASGQDGLSAGIRTTAEAAGSNCTTGGQKVQAFKDDDKNGNYDAGEVLLGTASYVCNGQVGAVGAQGVAGTAASMDVSSVRTCRIDLRGVPFTNCRSSNDCLNASLVKTIHSSYYPEYVMDYTVTTFSSGMKNRTIARTRLATQTKTTISSEWLPSNDVSNTITTTGSVFEAHSQLILSDGGTSLGVVVEYAFKATYFQSVSNYVTVTNGAYWTNISCHTINY